MLMLRTPPIAQGIPVVPPSVSSPCGKRYFRILRRRVHQRRPVQVEKLALEVERKSKKRLTIARIGCKIVKGSEGQGQLGRSESSGRGVENTHRMRLLGEGGVLNVSSIVDGSESGEITNLVNLQKVARRKRVSLKSALDEAEERDRHS